MKLNELLNLDIESVIKMKQPTLQKVVSHLQKISLNRFNKLKQKKYTTNFTIAFEKSMKRLQKNVEKMNLNQLRNSFVGLSNILKYKTSTVTGTKKVLKKIEKRLGVKFTPRQQKKFFEVYRKVSEFNPVLKEKYGSEKLMQMVHDEYQKTDRRRTVDSILDDVLDNIEKSSIKEDNEDEEYSKFIDEIYGGSN